MESRRALFAIFHENLPEVSRTIVTTRVYFSMRTTRKNKNSRKFTRKK